MTDAISRSRKRWSLVFWVVEVMAIAAILGIILLLQYSEEGYMRQHGIRITATVDELPPGIDSCVQCPLLFTIDGRRHRVKETLVADYNADETQRRYVPGETIELYVDPNDVSNTIEVAAIEGNIALGVFGIGVVAAFTVAWPIFEYKRSIQPSTTHAPN